MMKSNLHSLTCRLPYHRACPAFLLAMVLLLAVPVQADWPQFHGPAGLGRADGPPVPTRWSAEENIAWKAPLPGRGASSPVVFGNLVYVNASIESGQLVALAQETGVRVWTLRGRRESLVGTRPG